MKENVSHTDSVSCKPVYSFSTRDILLLDFKRIPMADSSFLSSLLSPPFILPLSAWQELPSHNFLLFFVIYPSLLPWGSKICDLALE